MIILIINRTLQIISSPELNIIPMKTIFMKYSSGMMYQNIPKCHAQIHSHDEVPVIFLSWLNNLMVH